VGRVRCRLVNGCVRPDVAHSDGTGGRRVKSLDEHARQEAETEESERRLRQYQNRSTNKVIV
jgi:hypothetical protein